MPRLKSILAYNSIQFRTLLLLVLVFISLVGLLSYSNKLIFERFLGSMTPWVIAVVISILGIAAFAVLLIDKGFVVYKKSRAKHFFGLRCQFYYLFRLPSLSIGRSCIQRI